MGTKQERREKKRNNRRKMVVTNRSIFNIVKIKVKKASK